MDENETNWFNAGKLAGRTELIQEIEKLRTEYRVGKKFYMVQAMNDLLERLDSIQKGDSN